MAGTTPRRATGRASARLPGRVRRALDGSVDSTRVYGDSLEVDREGRLETRVAKRGSGLIVTREGLKVDQEAVGEKNREAMTFQQDLTVSGITAAEVATALNLLLAELRRTGNMRNGGF